jgi:hypothetical protein
MILLGLRSIFEGVPTMTPKERERTHRLREWSKRFKFESHERREWFVLQVRLLIEQEEKREEVKTAKA